MSRPFLNTDPYGYSSRSEPQPRPSLSSDHYDDHYGQDHHPMTQLPTPYTSQQHLSPYDDQHGRPALQRQDSSQLPLYQTPQTFAVGQFIDPAETGYNAPPPVQQPYGYPPSPSVYSRHAASPVGYGPGPGQYGQTPHTPFQQWTAPSPQYLETRDRMMRRRSVKQITLDQGNLVLEIPVPSHVLPPPNLVSGAQADGGEMHNLRYSAVTCDPDLFKSSNYTLRPAIYRRETELFICLTQYNEDHILFLKTLNACIRNIEHLSTRNRSKIWGPGSWKKVVICIVQDGRKAVNPRTLKVLQLMGLYSEGVMKDSVAGKPVTGHIFEASTQVIVSESGEVGFGAVPIQMLFCLKEKNAKKLNSHRWFFNAFGPVLNPNVCLLLDVGTKPVGNSLYNLHKVFVRNKNCGGACGEICADLGKLGSKLFNPLVASQNLEYKLSNILDKPFESATGLISVLPGAFSAYRYQALLNHADGTGPLNAYFKGEAMHSTAALTTKLSESNAYLAEDRVLAFELVTKKKAQWRLCYVKNAQAITDVPESVVDLISQRRRWTNGSFFAATHSVSHFWRVWTSGHNFFRKLLLTGMIIYNAISLLFQWFGLSSFYLAFFFIGQSTTSGANDPFFGVGPQLFAVMNKVYIAMIIVVLVCSLGNRPAGSRWLYMGAILVFVLCQGMLLYCAGFTIYKTIPRTVAEWTNFSALWANSTFRSLTLSMISTFGVYLLASTLYLSPWHMITSFAQYMLLLGFYINILWIFASCNLHDVSWGNRPEAKAEDLGGAKPVEKDGKALVEVEVPTSKADIDALWTQARAELRIPVKEEHQKRSPEVKKKDSYAVWRTNFVLINLACNMAIVLLFTDGNFVAWISRQFNTATSASFNPYLTFIFWSVLGMTTVRFLGSMIYLLLWTCGIGY